MKKIVAIFILIVFCFFSFSCYKDIYYDSIDQYKERIKEYGTGYSSCEIDHPKYFLPSQTFLSDYEYTEGGYHYYEEDLFRELFQGKRHPEISLLYLKYETEVYENAKTFMMQSILDSNEIICEYNGYVFYVNCIFTEPKEGLEFPRWFTMVGYNDVNNTLLFMGFVFSYISDEDEILLKSLTWKDFINTYYGSYYDFEET